jgi:exodeoxyribonuclease V gamma subunit
MQAARVKTGVTPDRSPGAPVRVHRSNRLETLMARLAGDVAAPVAALAGAPGALVVPETIVVQSRGMERWVAMALAAELGVWAHPRFVYPRSLVHGLVDDALDVDAESRGRWERESLTWAVAAVLPGLLPDPRFEPLRRWLQGPDPGGRRPVQLAGQIAHVFDQYAVYRPAMVLAWEAGKDTGVGPEDAWQPALWRELVASLGNGHFAARAQAFLVRARDGLPDGRLPPRLSLFGITTLPPLYLQVLAAVDGRVPVTLYHHSPSDRWFADDRPMREIRRLERSLEDDAEALHLEQGHPLLASMGRVARDLQWLLADLEPVVEVEELDEFVDPGADTLLHRLQQDVRFRRPRVLGTPGPHEAPAVPLLPGDRSVQVHACHGPMREVEVLRDQLLDLLKEDEQLRPRDIVVMMPSVDTYAPFVDAVFGGDASQDGHIPYRIADRPPRADNQVVEAFLALLQAARGRLGAPEVLDLFAHDVVREKAGLAGDDVPVLREWAAASGIRWAVDAGHRRAEQQPDDPGNTWRFGLDRLVLGYAMGDEAAGLWQGTLPFPGMEGGAAARMGRFVGVCESLFALRGQVSRPRTPAGWQPVLAAALARFVHQDDANAWQHQAVREALLSLATRSEQAGFTDPVQLEVMLEELELAFAEPGAAHGFLSGGLTFCALLPMRSIPFRVVCLLGMNDDAFPRQVRAPGFDRTGAAPERGDRSPRDDDRYLFLEAMLSARDVLLLTYTGLGIQDNKERPPSACVAELLDVLGAASELGAQTVDLAEAQERIRARLVQAHPLQPFSPRYFEEQETPGGPGPLFSYARRWCSGAEALRGAASERPPLIEGPLPEDNPDAGLSLKALIDFLTDPARGLLRARLGVRLDEQALVLDDREPADLGPLDRYAAGQRLLDAALEGEPMLLARAELRATGLLPLGTPGEVAVDALLPAVETIAAVAAPLREGARQAPLTLDLACGSVRLVGAVEDLWPQGRVVARYSRLGPDKLLAEWVRHLGMCCAEPDPGAGPPGVAPVEQSAAVGRSVSGEGVRHVRFGPVPEAAEHLETLVGLWQAGQVAPLPLLPGSAMAYVAALRDGVDAEKALGKARTVLSGARYKGYGDWGPYAAAVWGDTDPLAPDASVAGDFLAVAEAVMGPLLDHLEEA